MTGRLWFVKCVYWVGAVLDAISILPFVIPALAGRVLPVDMPEVGPETRYAMYMGAALMAGWTALLIWGAFKPIARRGLLLLTVFPVMVGILSATVYLGIAGAAEFSSVVPMIVFQTAVLLLMFAAWSSARALSVQE